MAVEVIDRPAGGGDCGKCGGHLDRLWILKAEHSSIEQLVMQRTESQAIVETVRAPEVEPPDVRRLDPHGRPRE